jgi:hypothetical protein
MPCPSPGYTINSVGTFRYSFNARHNIRLRPGGQHSSFAPTWISVGVRTLAEVVRRRCLVILNRIRLGTTRRDLFTSLYGTTLRNFETVIAMLTSFAALIVISGLAFNQAQGGVARLFEDDAEGILKLLTNAGDGPGQGEPDRTNVFSGVASLKITQYQRFHRTLPDWKHVIREMPKAGEYRYLRFAWKSGGANTLMLQLHDATDWHIRYTAGPNVFGWQSRIVADKAPAEWTLITIDLFKDFGDRTLTGIAFTIDGGAGNFDHVYLGRTIADLDRIDANGLAKKPIKLETKDLDQHWFDLTHTDASKQYRAFWTLVGGRETSAAYIKAKLSPPNAKDAESKQISEWIRSLNSNSFVQREKAMAELKKRIEAVLPILEAELARTPPAETRRRIEALIAQLPDRDRELARRTLAIRALDYIVTVPRSAK